jgi:hypothetical protein
VPCNNNWSTDTECVVVVDVFTASVEEEEDAGDDDDDCDGGDGSDVVSITSDDENVSSRALGASHVKTPRTDASTASAIPSVARTHTRFFNAVSPSMFAVHTHGGATE